MNPRPVKEGVWLYEGVAPTRVIAEQVDFKPGSGDYEDAADEREDKTGIFFRLSYTAAGDSRFSNVRGYFDTLEAAVREAEKTFAGMRWTS